MQFFGIFAIHCLAVIAIAAAAADEEVSPATLQQLQIIENSIATSLNDIDDCDDDSTSPNRTLEPCDDFYAYACGNSGYEELRNYSNQFIAKTIFLQALDNFFRTEYPAAEQIKKYNQSFTDKVLTFYYSCESQTTLDLFKTLKPSNEMEWPLIDDYKGKHSDNVDNFDIFGFLGRMRGYGFDDLLLASFVRRESNGSLYIELDVPYVSEVDEYQTKEMLSIIDETNVKTIGDIRNYYEEIKKTQEEWSLVLQEFTTATETSEMFSYQQIKQLHPKVAKFLDALLPNQIEDDDLIVFANTKFFEFLSIKEWQPQETRKFLNYFMALIQEAANALHYENCADRIFTQMNFAVNFMYRKSVYPTEVQTAIEDLKEKILKSLLELIDENHLEFNDKQMQAIKDKLASTYFSIGNVPANANDAMLEKFYSHLPDMDINNYSKNYLMSLRQRFWETINCPPNMDCSKPYDYGTYSIAEKNLVIISLSALMPGLYDSTYDPILAVSAMGSLMASEYGHLIDTDALKNSKIYNSLYDDFRNNANLQASRECTKQQFTTDYIRQMEDDLIGFSAAFRLYYNEYKVQPAFTEIPWQQLFFLNFAQNFCELRNWSEQQPSEYNVRINYVAMNMEEFSEAFECPVGSKMNPVDKCFLY